MEQNFFCTKMHAYNSTRRAAGAVADGHKDDQKDGASLKTD